ncbi:MAG: rhodanese-like domain-containing protein [Deltaproteobacteria bacterium]|nr:rhodanese-like domain-containing protein [Deltaproteobacteria bacterium]
MVSVLVRALILVAAGAVAGLVGNAVRPDRVALLGFTTPTTCEGAEAGVREVSVTEGQALCGTPGLVFADARSAESYARGHVAGAVHLPCDAKGRGAVDAIAQLDEGTTVLVYGDSTEAARAVADSLARRSRRPVLLLQGGFPAWDSGGGACASGACEACGTGDGGHAHDTGTAP